ncbi:EGF-like domain [Trinorchestia longiramus]|nr:EGF-like domain [Trinorchestia longiramus]
MRYWVQGAEQNTLISDFALHNCSDQAVKSNQIFQDEMSMLRIVLVVLLVIACSADTSGSHRRQRRQYSGNTNVGYSQGRAAPSRSGRLDRQEIKRCVNIHEIANGQVVCAYSGCRLRCSPGYKFIVTETVRSHRVLLDCDHTSGDLFFRDRKWSPDMTVCAPVCDATCENGGTCVAPNKCACAGPYAGPTCSEEPMLGDQPYGGYQLKPVGDNERRIECEPGTRMPDGSTSVTLQYRDNSWFYPDGRMLLGVDQVTCETAPVTAGPEKPYEPTFVTVRSKQPTEPPVEKRPNPLTAPEPHYVPNIPNNVDENPASFIAPSCNPPCQNGGECVFENTCSCPRGYWGPTCSVNSCTYPRFSKDLHASLGGTLKRMKFECHPGHHTRQRKDRVVVLCVGGVWRLTSGRLLVEDDVLCLPDN